ncbi:MAG TPA: CAP domain-containing protein [Planctomycetes bacterium]|nr:CAP domain-containing protein [Planctomycetota bacterium]
MLARFILPLALTSALLGSAPERPDDDLTEMTVSGLVGVVRNTRKDVVDREPAMEELLGRGYEAAFALGRELEKQSQRIVAKFEKSRDKFIPDFEKAALQGISVSLDRKAWARIEELRKTSLGVSRGKALTESAIRQTCDPAMNELAGMLGATVQGVLDNDEDLTEAHQTTRSLAQDAWILRDWWDDAVAVLAETERGEKLIKRLSGPDALEGSLDGLELQLTQAIERATPMSDASRATFKSNEQTRLELTPEEYLGNRRLNLIRVRLGLRALRTDIKLTRACRGHSKDMAVHGFFSHTSPVPGKETPWKRAALEGGSAGAENIAAGQRSGHGAISAWWYSPGHHRNMLANHGSQGLGRYQSHWTQLFGG